MFKKILIANRGEIACRVIKTARRMGIATVAVYSEADRGGLHVDMADEAVCIGPAASRDSYLNIDAILAACVESGAEAVHPGYGFLSENAAFARRLEAAGLVFIGPGAEAIAAMGDKIASKKLAEEAGVNVIPGCNEAVESVEAALEIALGIGYPVMIKASAGGGGKGLRVAHNDDEAREGFAACRSEAANAFGDDRVFIEKFVVEPRHIEIQVLGDAHGNVVYLNERECSIQRRHQKLIEEAPSSFVDAAMRRAMGEQAVALAKAVGYRSAGTVEFVVGADKAFYFLEMNTRLQVEHPVTEFVTGLDLVEQMIRIAAGESLAFTQEAVGLNGWAMECRINAEDPARGFLPSSGRLIRFLPPPEEAGSVRVDTGVFEGGEIPVYYDSLIAKLVVHGQDRDETIARMREALNRFVIRGVRSNIAFHGAVMQHDAFRAGTFTTHFIADNWGEAFDAAHEIHSDALLPAVLIMAVHWQRAERAARISGRCAERPRRLPRDWVVSYAGQSFALQVTPQENVLRMTCNGAVRDVEPLAGVDMAVFEARVDGVLQRTRVERRGLHYVIGLDGVELEARVLTARSAELLTRMPPRERLDAVDVLRSPMPGLLREVLVVEGQNVKAGERLAVIEAMKMENVLRAEHDGRIKAVVANPGMVLAVDDVILEYE